MMDKRLRDVIDSIDYYELLKMKQDLDTGGHHLRTFINKEIENRQREHSVSCSTCGSHIEPSSPNTQTLIFGSSDFKKKATFCGKDCLSYFLSKTEEMKKGQMPKTMNIHDGNQP
ncbi:hypothetical protein H6503_03430 [Candidatus Woesearchaeota archaeon]|nr:hypothetical protein [Candidatus Woesearchaeota archaeon]